MSKAKRRASKGENRKSVLIFRNRQRMRQLDVPLLRQIARCILADEFKVCDYELGFHFVDATEMARVNEQFLQHKGSTDVITFDHGSSSGQLHGELFISMRDALKHARIFRSTWQSEIIRYLIHGLLHLRGFDDLEPKKRRVMKLEENRLLHVIESRFPIDKLAERATRNQTGTSC